MALTPKLCRVMSEAQLLAQSVRLRVPHDKGFANEIDRIFTQGNQLYPRTRNIDEIVGLSRPGGVPKNQIDVLELEIRSLCEKIVFTRKQLDIHLTYEKLSANYRENSFFSSEDEIPSPAPRPRQQQPLSPVFTVPQQRYFASPVREETPPPPSPITPSVSSCSPRSTIFSGSSSDTSNYSDSDTDSSL